MIYLQLFWAFFQIGLFSIGGGYAALPLIQARVVDEFGWMTLSEFTDIVTISQMTPGPIGINAATFVGTKIAGLSGAVIATAGCVAPSFVIVLILAYVYSKYRELNVVRGVLTGLRPAVVGLIAASGVSITILAFWNAGTLSINPADLNLQAVAIFAVGLFVLRKWKASPVYVMLGAGALGLVWHFVQA